MSNQSNVSIAKDRETPYVNQRSRRGRCDLVGDEIYVRCLKYANEFSRITSERLFPPYKVYTWQAKTFHPQTNTYMYMGLYGGANGWIDFRCIDTTIRCSSSNNGSGSTNTTITGVNATWNVNAPKVFKIDWEAGRIRFYVDGNLVATHSTNIPSSAMPFFVKVENQSTDPAHEAGIDYKARSLVVT